MNATAPKTSTVTSTAMAATDSQEFDDDDFEEFDPADDCMLMDDGQCMAAGSEWCEFECPFRVRFRRLCGLDRKA